MSQPFKGVPVSSKSQMEVPVEVVSQPSGVDIDKLYGHAKDVGSVEDIPARAVPTAEQLGTSELPEVSTKAEAVRSGQLKVSDLSATDFDDFMSASIVAIPKRLPTMLDVRAKDPNFRLRWINFKADGGRRVDECKAEGFTLARKEEVIGLESDSIMVQTDGIKYHDVLLMKVSTQWLFGRLKQNALESMRMVSPKRLHKAAVDGANKVVRQGINDSGRSYAELKDTISFYTPGEGEVPNR